MEYTLDFEEVDRASIPVVGGKNASLGEMIQAGIRVPPGFAVTTWAYLDFLQKAGLQDRVLSLLEGLDPEDVAALERVSEEVRQIITSNPIPGEILETIKSAYEALCKRSQQDNMPVAVRSSATAEDLPTASFAGQQDTYLWIKGADEVLQKVQSCWASLFTPRAISYRIKNRFPHEKVLISVGVQKMVNAKAAGVMFTLNPTDGDLSKVVVEGSWGLGETVVSGTVNPDKFVVDKVLMETTEKTISTKHIQCIFDPEKGGVQDLDVPEELQNTCCLEEREVKELVTLAKRIEKHYGIPMDIEWAIDRDLPFPENVFIVQARPETVWTQRERKPVIGPKSGRQLLMEQAMKRIKIP